MDKSKDKTKKLMDALKKDGKNSIANCYDFDENV